MTEKVEFVNSNFILHVRPVSFFSKCFSQSQIQGYSTMEKEFLGLMLAVNNFRDYIMAAPITFVLSQ